MKINLSFTSKVDKMPILQQVAAKHGLSIKQEWEVSGVTKWTILTKIDLSDVCNFINEVGFRGVIVTISQ
jgi:hypothetical protein